MENKKSKDASLENKKLVFFTLGLLMSASLVLMAFKYESAVIPEKKVDNKIAALEQEFVYDIPEDDEIIEEEPAVIPPVVIDQIIIVDDDIVIDDFDLFDFDTDADTSDYDIDTNIIAEPIADFAEIEPSFPGGESAMMEWIQKHIEYPQLAVEMGEQGIVYCQFVVNKDGSIEQVKIVRKVSDLLDEEAKDVIKKMPKWTPGEQAGKKVRCRFTLPIHFRLG